MPPCVPGRLDGHFGDLMNVFTQNERGVPQAVILTTTHTSRAQRAFGLVVAPAAAEKIRSLKDLDGTETAHELRHDHRLPARPHEG